MAVLFETKQKTIPLINDFIIPPFSYLDTKMKYWKDRRSMWNKYVGDSTETRDGDFGRAYNFQKQSLQKRTSTFDPVLVEIMYKWFCPKENIKILDPFGGEQTKGVVAGCLGYDYYGIELRQEQVDVNTKLAEKYPSVHYVCGNSVHIDDVFMNNDFTFLFTSPPYYNLEVYSDGDSDISAKQSYEDFMFDLTRIFIGCYRLMQNNTFAVIKVGELRKDNGSYYGFVPDFIRMMVQCGWQYYNEIILLNDIGSAQLRAAGNMKSRKIVKLHQNILVFYKGDMSKIKYNYKELRE